MSTTTANRKPWLGGYVRPAKGGKYVTFIIDRRIGGVHFHVSTKCRTEKAAIEQLKLFEADPDAYCRNRDYRPPTRQALFLSEELVDEYTDWMLTRERPAGPEWTASCGRFLTDWMEDLGDKDVRDWSVTGDLKPALKERKTSRKHRIEAIKAFCAWLRKEKGLLKHAEDPTLDLAVPQATAEKLRRRKVVDRENVEKVLLFLREEVRDMLLLQTGTAFHLSEVKRFAKGGDLQRPPAGTTIDLVTRDGVRRVPLLAVAVVKHKSGERVGTPLIEEVHVQAAERVRARGRSFSTKTINVALKAACKKAGVEYFTLGVMRHSVLTWAVELGGHMKTASEFAHHKSEKTTKAFYVDLQLPVSTVPVMRPQLEVIPGGKATG